MEANMSYSLTHPFISFYKYGWYMFLLALWMGLELFLDHASQQYCATHTQAYLPVKFKDLLTLYRCIAFAWLIRFWANLDWRPIEFTLFWCRLLSRATNPTGKLKVSTNRFECKTSRSHTFTTSSLICLGSLLIKSISLVWLSFRIFSSLVLYWSAILGAPGPKQVGFGE